MDVHLTVEAEGTSGPKSNVSTLIQNIETWQWIKMIEGVS